jgi:hypothetical protein
MISTADAPSVIWELLPAVTLPPFSAGTNAGFSLASVSGVVPRRMPSSALTISSLSMSLLPVEHQQRDAHQKEVRCGTDRHSPGRKAVHGNRVIPDQPLVDAKIHAEGVLGERDQRNAGKDRGQALANASHANVSSRRAAQAPQRSAAQKETDGGVDLHGRQTANDVGQ